MREKDELLEQINDQYDEWMKELSVREKRLKLLVRFNDDDMMDDVIGLLRETKIDLLS